MRIFDGICFHFSLFHFSVFNVHESWFQVKHKYMIAKKSSQLSFSIATFIFIYLLSNSLLMKGFKYFALRASKVGLISSIRLDGRKTSNLKSLLNFALRAFKFSFG